MPNTKQPLGPRGSRDVLLKTKDVAERYGISEWGVRRMVRAKKIEAVNIGNDRRRILRFSEAALAKFEKSAAA